MVAWIPLDTGRALITRRESIMAVTEFGKPALPPETPPTVEESFAAEAQDDDE
jgi:hypothetical protein